MYELPLEAVPHEALVLLDVFLHTHATMVTEPKMGALAIKLAREVFFGDSILQKCSPRGSGNFPFYPMIYSML